MPDATWTHSQIPFGDAAHNLGRRKITSTSRTAALRSLGSIVYAARLADGTIKIGWTARAQDRLRYLVAYVQQDVELVAFRAGTYEDEQEIHGSLVAYRIEGKREFYHPTAEVLAVVNAMRADLNMPPLAA